MSSTHGRISGTLLWTALLLFFLTGCGDEAGPSPPDYGSGAGQSVEPRAEAAVVADPRVIVTSDDASLLENCRPRPVAEVVFRFVDAFNRGDRLLLSQIFFVSEGPSPPDFSPAGYYPWSWYSSSEVGTDGKFGRNFTTSDQEKLLRYFAKRHERGERLRLLKVSLTQQGLLDEENNVGFLFLLTRKASDFGPKLGGPARIAYGKGALNCRNGRIFTWNMNMKIGEKRTAREAAAWLCEDPPGWRPGEGVVACT